MTQRPDAGLSLIEMLVALAILSVIGIAGLAMLDTTLNVQRRTEDRLERLEQIDRALTVLRRDLATAAPGFVELNAAGLGFSRLTSAGPYTIRYGLEGSTLTRLARPFAETSEPQAQQLLTGVRAARWRLLDADRTWHTDLSGAEARPRAAELSLRIDLPGREEPGEVLRLFPMPAGATP